MSPRNFATIYAKLVGIYGQNADIVGSCHQFFKKHKNVYLKNLYKELCNSNTYTKFYMSDFNAKSSFVSQAIRLLLKLRCEEINKKRNYKSQTKTTIDK